MTAGQGAQSAFAGLEQKLARRCAEEVVYGRAPSASSVDASVAEGPPDVMHDGSGTAHEGKSGEGRRFHSIPKKRWWDVKSLERQRIHHRGRHGKRVKICRCQDGLGGEQRACCSGADALAGERLVREAIEHRLASGERLEVALARPRNRRSSHCTETDGWNGWRHSHGWASPPWLCAPW